MTRMRRTDKVTECQLTAEPVIEGLNVWCGESRFVPRRFALQNSAGIGQLAEITAVPPRGQGAFVRGVLKGISISPKGVPLIVMPNRSNGAFLTQEATTLYPSGGSRLVDELRDGS